VFHKGSTGPLSLRTLDYGSQYFWRGCGPATNDSLILLRSIEFRAYFLKGKKEWVWIVYEYKLQEVQIHKHNTEDPS
jgi:hypothetical protein